MARDEQEATRANTAANARSAERARELVAKVAPVELQRIHDEYEEERARHTAFSEKRHRHYGNEAAALKRAAAHGMGDEEE